MTWIVNSYGFLVCLFALLSQSTVPEIHDTSELVMWNNIHSQWLVIPKVASVDPFKRSRYTTASPRGLECRQFNFIRFLLFNENRISIAAQTKTYCKRNERKSWIADEKKCDDDLFCGSSTRREFVVILLRNKTWTANDYSSSCRCWQTSLLTRFMLTRESCLFWNLFARSIHREW